MATALVQNDADDSYSRVGHFSHEIKKCHLKPGDHIYCWRIGYQHHGIYIGKPGREVVHFSGPRKEVMKNKNTATIRAATLVDFLDGAALCLVAYGVTRVGVALKLHGTRHACKSKDPSDVVKTTEYYCDNPDKWCTYNFAMFNCEDFAFYCKTEKRLTDGQGSKFNLVRKLGMGDSMDDSYGRVGYFSHSIDKSNLKLGDHVYCWRGIYQHHGIYIGEPGREVIHFNTETGGETVPTVCATSLDDFLDGDVLRLVAYGASRVGVFIKLHGCRHRCESRPPNDVVETAKHYCDNPQEWPEYSLLLNNSEDFAFYCKTQNRLTDGHGSKFNLAKKIETTVEVWKDRLTYSQELSDNPSRVLFPR